MGFHAHDWIEVRRAFCPAHEIAVAEIEADQPREPTNPEKT